MPEGRGSPFCPLRYCGHREHSGNHFGDTAVGDPSGYRCFCSESGWWPLSHHVGMRRDLLAENGD